VLERPQNVAFVAQSAAGKNRAVDAALELIPPEAVYVEKAGSARALVYADEDFRHRVVVVAEADSIPEDGPAASAIRSLASDNELAYDVVEKNPQSGQFETRRIVKPGPTGLITTSTRSLGTQMGTRMLEVPLPDDAEQTRKVMQAHALTVMPAIAEPPDLEPFLAVQRWLALAGNRRVAVPFARVLADLLPADAVRMRRDFRQLLTCVQAIGLLHQRQRRLTPEGWIEATVEDYAQARDLLVPIFDTIAADGATPAIRQTVEAVTPGEELSAAALATRLGLSRATVSWRVNRALKGGWLVNNEARKGHPAKLARGAPLPEQTTALPLPERVQEVFECSNGDRDGGDTPSPLPRSRMGRARDERGSPPRRPPATGRGAGGGRRPPPLPRPSGGPGRRGSARTVGAARRRAGRDERAAVRAVGRRRAARGQVSGGRAAAACGRGVAASGGSVGAA
jgi:hypothetical protein